MALAPDGRVFVTELGSGVLRLVDPTGALVATPFATVPVVTGSHRGLLGVALSPDFATDGRVFALACTPAGSGKPERSVLYRWNDVGGSAQNQIVLLDDLPISTINNGGALCFDAAGMLLVSIGDTENPALAQADGSFAGKILRLDPADGSAAAGNPTPGSRVFAKGLRNTFALTRDPVNDALLLADNGPASDDELDLLQPGRNFEWGAAPGAAFGALTGTQLRHWPDVVVPTGLAFRDTTDALDWPAAHERSLYLTFYDDEIVMRFELSGSQRTDIDRELEFLRFVPNGTANKPLDIQRGPDGRLWILTFTAIYRLDRIR
jgi:glucose/arabinose dehydrogenase